MNTHVHTIAPGFIALHGNRAEDLADTVLDWLRLNPLGPLEDEVVLVQSNGMAEWFKMDMARRHGVCAAARVELPGRFLWRTYRQVLGPQAVPSESPLDKLPLTWRLMTLLPTLVDQPDFAPVKAYLRPDEPDRLLQLATQLADLLDQYQNYRDDWLGDWAVGQDVLRQPNGTLNPLPPGQRWQVLLWRAVLGTLGEGQQAVTRPQLHRQVLARLNADTAPTTPSAADEPPAAGDTGFSARIARRVLVFGMSSLPAATLETLAALSRHCQVLLAIPNPCRHDWGDIMEGRELFRTLRKRQLPRNGEALTGVNLEDMHQHAHPLLAAWGRQGRDFIRLLDAFDDAQATLSRFALPRIDVFDDAEDALDTPLLTRVQHRIRDLEPARLEGDASPVADSDQSICFVSAHSAVRELEVLQDNLLRWLAESAHTDTPLHPRDVVVMVPDIEALAPAIRAVFGQYPRHDARHIPFDIADLSAESSSLVITALEWLLRLPVHRCGLSELVDVLEVPAVAARFGLDAEQLPALTAWMQGAGLRWGLNLAHRQQLGLGACGEQNSAWFGLQRMLLGYASGDLAGVAADPAWAHIEPYTEVGGLDAELAGTLAHLIQALLDWWAVAVQAATPGEWVVWGRALLAALFKPVDEADQQALGALNDGLMAWARACEHAGFEQAVDVTTCRQAWFQALSVPSLERRFRAGGVTFCTLMPMRAIPFEVVCLLGMNDGDYPRQTPRNDFDLMAQPGQFRPGDRSRRQDDRQLMLEALLSARRTLCISWTGHSVRDHSEQPPSVLVSQLRDYLDSVWGPGVLAARTTVHPLQPFSRRYFEAGSGLTTLAREWHALHEGVAAAAAAVGGLSGAASAQPALAGGPSDLPPLPPFVPDPAVPLTLKRLTGFLRNPVKQFFRERLGVVFDEGDEEAADEEAFDLQGLLRYHLVNDQLAQWPEAPEAAHGATGTAAQATQPPTRPANQPAETPTETPAETPTAKPLPQRITASLQRLRRTGVLPMQAFGDLEQAELEHTLHHMAEGWQRAASVCPHRAPRLAVEWTGAGVTLRDWLDPLFQDTAHSSPAQVRWLQLSASKLLEKKADKKSDKPRQPRPDKLMPFWLRALAAAASGHRLHGTLVAVDGTLHMAPMDAEAAQDQLNTLLELWLHGMQAPLPLPLTTAVEAVRLAQKGADGTAQDTYEGSDHDRSRAEVNEPCLARVYPDFEALCDGTGFDEMADAVYAPLLTWVANCVTVEPNTTSARRP